MINSFCVLLRNNDYFFNAFRVSCTINISPMAIKLLLKGNNICENAHMSQSCHVDGVMKEHFLCVWKQIFRIEDRRIRLLFMNEPPTEKNKTNFLSILFLFLDITCFWCQLPASFFQPRFQCISGEKHSQTHGSSQRCSVGLSSWMSPGWLTAPLTNGETNHTMCKFSRLYFRRAKLMS